MRAGFCAPPIRPSNFVTSCASHRPSSMHAFAHADAAVREHRDRERRLRGGDEQLLALQRVDRQAVQRSPDEIANTIGSVPTSSVHWFTFDDTSAPRPAFGVEPPREHARDRAARALPTRAARATAPAGTCRCRTRSPVSTSDSANGSAHSRIATTDADEQRDRRRARRCASGSVPISVRGPDEVRLLGRRPRDPHQVERRRS